MRYWRFYVKLAVAAFLICSAVALASCVTPAQPVPSYEKDLPYGRITVETVEVNGRTVSCVLVSGSSMSGISCDFTRATS